MRDTKKWGKGAGGSDTPNKTDRNVFEGFADGIVAQDESQQVQKDVCRQCGAGGVKLYSGGTGRMDSLCGDCLLPIVDVDDGEPTAAIEENAEPGESVRIFRPMHCYVCDKARPRSLMSRLPVICRECLENDGSRHAKLRFEKGLLRINRALRRAACI